MRPWLLALTAGCVVDAGPDDSIEETDGTQDSEPTVVPTVLDVQTSGIVACPDPWAPADGPRFRAVPLPPQGSPARWYGPGTVIEDFNGDGRPDLFLAQSVRADRLLLQGVDGTFADASDRLPASARGIHLGGAAADLNADGRADLYVVTHNGPDRIWTQQADGFVEEVLPVPSDETRYGVVIGDADADGRLDLFLSSGAAGAGVFGDIPPDITFPAVGNGNNPPDVPDPNRLFLGVDDGFVEVTDTLPARVRDLYAFTAAFLDVNGDGADDVFVPADFGSLFDPNAVLSRTEDGWADIAPAHALDTRIFGMSAATGDLFGRGVPDLFVTDIDSVHLYTSQDGQWFDQASAKGLVLPATERPSFAWGGALADLDNDGLMDVAAVLGPSVGEERNTDSPTPGPRGLRVWRQQAGVFSSATAAYGLDDGVSGRSIAVTDLDGDGFLDLVRSGWRAPATVYRNQCDDSQWVTIRLSQPGPNPQAIGARVVITAGDVVLTRWIRVGGDAYGTSTPPVAHAGLGEASAIDRIEVRWPDGTVEVQEGPWPAAQHLTVSRR